MSNLAINRNVPTFIPLQMGTSKSAVDISTLNILSNERGLIYSTHFNSPNVILKFFEQKDPKIDLRVDLASNLLFQNLGWTQMNVSFQNNTGQNLIITFFEEDNFYKKNTNPALESSGNCDIEIEDGKIALVTLYAFRSMLLTSSYVLVEPLGFLTPPSPPP
jgi:hypothetical protein